GEDVEDPRREVRVGPVVEGERDHLLLGLGAPPHPGVASGTVRGDAWREAAVDRPGGPDLTGEEARRGDERGAHAAPTHLSQEAPSVQGGAPYRRSRRQPQSPSRGTGGARR